VTDYLFKILVVGEQGTGKTSIIKRYVHNIFSVNYKCTIGVDFALKVINWSDSAVVRLQLWDIAGQERFGNMTRVYYKEAVGAMVVFSIGQIETFEEVRKWKADIDSKVTIGEDGRPIPVVLLANKCDLDTTEGGFAQNNKEKMDAFCKEHGFVGWFATSAKDSIGIDEASRHLVSKILENHDADTAEAAAKGPDTVKIEKEKPGSSSDGGCCT